MFVLCSIISCGAVVCQFERVVQGCLAVGAEWAGWLVCHYETACRRGRGRIALVHSRYGSGDLLL